MPPFILLPVIDEDTIGVYLVFQGEVEGEVFNAFVVVGHHFRGILVCLKVLDDIGKPD